MKPMLCASLFLLAATPVLATDGPTDRMARVEKGLRPALTIEGDAPWTLEERMRHYRVPAVSVAVINDFEVVEYRVYGLADRKTGEPATEDTLFQAGSVSKPVAAFGALKMVADGTLTLDGAVNDTLTSWTIPDNEFTTTTPVTLTHLLAHTGGLTVHGFPGYAVDVDVPTTIQVLDGSGPANTPPVRVDKAPGEGYRYSGGGYTIAQLMMADAAGTSFPALMDELVLQPIGMRRSTFLNPLPPDRLEHAAAGYLPDHSPVAGKRHTYPEMAAAGLWTTAEDLARFAVEVQLALRGDGNVLDRATAEKLVEPVSDHYGRGFQLHRRERSPYFGHGGWDAGFCASLIAHRTAGYGAVVMINSNHPQLAVEIIRGIGEEYGWAGHDPYPKLDVPQQALDVFPGRYRFNAETAFTIERRDDRLFMQYAGGNAMEMHHVGEGRYLRRENLFPITFTVEDSAATLHFINLSGSHQSHRRLADDERAPREILIDEGYEAALPVYRELFERSPDDPAISEDWLNRQGLGMAGDERYEPAIGLLRIATELYPQSANTWDSVGEAYRKMGRRDLSLRWYRRALEVDPEFPYSVRAVAELEAELAASEGVAEVDSYFVESTAFTSRTAPQVITRNVLQDRHGGYWLATWNGVVRYDGATFTNVTNREGLRRYRVFGVTEDREGNIWLGTTGAGVYRYDGRRYTNFTTADGLVHDTVLAMLQDRDGNLWFGGMGATKYDGATFTSYTEDDGFTGSDVHSIEQAPDGAIWFGTRGALFRYDGRAFENVTKTLGVDVARNSYTPAVIDRRGHVWFGGSNGLHHFDGTRVQRLFEPACFSLMEDSRGRIWFSGGGLDGPEPIPGTGVLSRFDPSAGLDDILSARETIEIKAGAIFGLSEDRDGTIWFGTGRGIGSIDGATVRYHQPAAWGPQQAAGPPDTPNGGDAVTAWATQEADAGPEWLRLTYARAVDVARVRVHETFNPGAVTSVTAATDGGEVVIWSGAPVAGPAPRWLELTPTSAARTNTITIHLDTSLREDWNEIDAVELIGADGSRQWAERAEASSFWGQ